MTKDGIQGVKCKEMTEVVTQLEKPVLESEQKMREG